MTYSSMPTDARIRKLRERLYEEHSKAGDARLELWPGDDVLAVLAYTRGRFRFLPSAKVSPLRREQLLLRMELIKLLYAKLDAEQLELLDQARPRDVGSDRHPVHLKDLAKVMGVTSPSSVNHRHARLLAAINERPRTPQHGRRILEERAERTRRQLLEMQIAQAHHAQVLQAARNLLDTRDELPLTEDGADWLDDLDQMAAEELRPEQMVGFAALLSLVIAGVAEEGRLPSHIRQVLVKAHKALAYRR